MFFDKCSRLVLLTLITAVISIGCSLANEPDVSTLPIVITPEVNEQPGFQSDAAYPVSDAYPVSANPETVDEAYPSPDSTNSNSPDGRSQSALTSLLTAQEVALIEFHEDAYLSAVLPSRQMLVNLGNPAVLPGWIFRFRMPDSPREFVIQIVDETVTGFSVMEAIQQLGTKELEVDISSLGLDSPELQTIYTQWAKDQGSWQEGQPIDFGLVNLENGQGPVWFVMNPLTQEIVFSVNAISGDIVSNPYE